MQERSEIRFLPRGARRVAYEIRGDGPPLVAPAWWLPQGPLWIPAEEPESAKETGRWTLVEETALYSQPELLSDALAAVEPGRPGIADLYLVAAGLYAREDVFMKEVTAIATLFRERRWKRPGPTLQQRR